MFLLFLYLGAGFLTSSLLLQEKYKDVRKTPLRLIFTILFWAPALSVLLGAGKSE